MSHSHWTNYWQSGVQTSLPQDFKNNYDGEIYGTWEKVVNDLPSGSNVTDLCTGNGAVALLLAEIALKQNKTLQITAIDISQINTESILANNPVEQTNMIQFISQTPVERLDSVLTTQQDAIVSQFGLEYSDIAITAKVIKHCLKSQGRLRFIAHSHDGAVFEYMDVEQSIYHWLQDIGVFNHIEAFVSGQQTANGLKNKIMSTVQNNQPKPEFMGHGLFKSWQTTLTQIIKQPNRQLKSQKQALGQYLAQHNAAWKRLEDMLNVSAKVAEDNWYQPFVKNGFILEKTKKLHYKNQHLVGQFFDFGHQSVDP